MRTCVPLPCPTSADHFRASGQLRQVRATSGNPHHTAAGHSPAPASPATQARPASPRHTLVLLRRPSTGHAFRTAAPPIHAPFLPVAATSHPPRRMGPGQHGRQRDAPATTLLRGIVGSQRPIEQPPGHGAGRGAAGWGTGARLGWGREQVERRDWLGRCARSCRARNEGWSGDRGFDQATFNRRRSRMPRAPPMRASTEHVPAGSISGTLEVGTEKLKYRSLLLTLL